MNSNNNEPSCECDDCNSVKLKNSGNIQFISEPFPRKEVDSMQYRNSMIPHYPGKPVINNSCKYLPLKKIYTPLD